MWPWLEQQGGCSQFDSITNLLLGMCREVWPDEEFGSNGMTTEEEVESLQRLLFNPSSGECLFHDSMSCCTVYFEFLVAMLAARTLENGHDCPEDGKYGWGKELPVAKVAIKPTFRSVSSDEEEEVKEVESRSYELEFDMKRFTYS